MNTSFDDLNRRSRHLWKLAALTSLLLALSGCENSQLVTNDSNEEANNGTEQPIEGADDAGHGPDEDAQVLEAGFMAGSWRIGDAEDDALIADMDLVHIGGESAVEGTFTMGSGLYTRLEDEQGDLLDQSSFDGDTLVLAWNPTDVADEVYTVEAQKVDDDTFTGRLTALDYEQLDREVTVTRYKFDGGDE